MAALVGPTSAGKTALALELAEHLPIEVISADSRTVYRWMDIGTAKPSVAERQRLPHHVVDVVDPDEPYTLATYQEQALSAIERVLARGRTPLLVGGAGLYVSAVCEGLALPDVPPDASFRTAMEERARDEGWQALQVELARVDPESAARIEPRNVRRVIRALEVLRATGRKFSAFQKRASDWPIECVLIGLQLERSALDERIDARVDNWMAAGFVDEVRGLLERGYSPSLPSMSSLGYREIAAYLAGTLEFEEAAIALKRATHQYARRQMTWFGARPAVHWLNAATVRAEDVLRLIPAG